MTDVLAKRMQENDPCRSMTDADLAAFYPEHRLWGRIEATRATSPAASGHQWRLGEAVRTRTAVAIAALALAGGAFGVLLSGVTSAGQEHGLKVSGTATQACRALDTPYGGALTGAYPSTVGQVLAWDEARAIPGSPGSNYKTWPSSEEVSACFYSGSFSGFPGPPGATSTYRSLVVLVGSQGQAVLDFAGPSGSSFNPPPPPQG